MAYVRDVERTVDRPAMLGMKWALAAGPGSGSGSEEEAEHGPLPHASHWGKEYLPRAVERRKDRAMVLETKFSRLLNP